MAADELIAQPTAVTGSIGVIFVGVNLTGLMQKYRRRGPDAHRRRPEGRRLLAAADAARGARAPAVGARRHARALQAGRGGGPPAPRRPRVDALADGRIYSADQALANGLVDGLGDLEQAVAATQRRAGLASARVVIYHRPREYRQNLYTQAPAIPRVAAARAGAVPAAGATGLPLLWAPGRWRRACARERGPASGAGASHRARAAGRARREPSRAAVSPEPLGPGSVRSVGPASVLVAEDLGHRHARRHRAVRRARRSGTSTSAPCNAGGRRRARSGVPSGAAPPSSRRRSRGS